MLLLRDDCERCLVGRCAMSCIDSALLARLLQSLQ
jgi:hypothetical protein